MPSEIKIYKVRDFIRKTEAGAIDFDRSVKIIRELAVAASFQAGCNILVDMRETTVTDETGISSSIAARRRDGKLRIPLSGKNSECRTG